MKTVDLYEVHRRLKDLGFHSIELNAERYALPSPEWIAKQSAYIARKAPGYVPETFDCFAFTRWSASRADFALAASKARGVGHTFAEAGCVLDRTAHAMNLVLCSDDKAYAFEPQNGVYRPVDSGDVWTKCRL
jgi:hypothetical protein